MIFIVYFGSRRSIDQSEKKGINEAVTITLLLYLMPIGSSYDRIYFPDVKFHSRQDDIQTTVFNRIKIFVGNPNPYRSKSAPL